MLERTAAGLESGNFSFHRVLPRSTRPPRRPKRLQSGFNQRHGPATTGTATNWNTHQDSFRGSHSANNEPSLLLDFLYPTQTRALLLRQQRTRLLPCRAGTGRLNVPRGCRYMSSPAADQPDNPSANEPAGEKTGENPYIPSSKQRSRWESESVPTKETYAIVEGEGVQVTVDDAERRSEHDELHDATLDRSNPEATLPQLLADSEGDLFHDVWDLYCRLDPQKRAIMRPRVVSYLSKSQSVVEAGRAKSLLRQVPVEQWDNGFLSAAVLVILRSGDQAHAVEIFKQGLHTHGLLGGFEYLLIDSVNKQQWGTMLDIWIAHCKHIARQDPDAEFHEKILEPLRSLESLGALYFSFERYLAADGMRVERWLDLEKSTKVGLRVLRRKFAVEALRQPCPPKQASIILSFWRDHGMYERYLWRMFDRWYTKRISPSTARMLPAIYQDFKSLPGAKPSVDIMRGIFKVHYPVGVKALEDLYQDWIRCWGELNQWGFEKFLKFFAHRGDVKRVQELWSRFVERFPWKLKTPRGFRSTMNVYAQAGDILGAEQELDRMVNHYKVEPDLDIFNTLLKCYVRAGDYNKTLSCFEDICDMLRPDSYTYTHIMAMSSSKGDLDRTIGFFNEARNEGVPVTKEMGLALVVAYCRNDMLIEAENICTQLAQRRITSIAMWNQLIHHNGMHGRLTRCYALLNDMKKFNLEWNHETIGHLLSAMVRVSQVSAAYQIIRDGVRKKTYVLQPEHFAIVMLGTMRTGDRVTAEALMSLMEEASIPVPFDAMVAYTATALKEAPNTLRTPMLSKELVASLRSLVSQPSGDVRQRRRETEHMGRAVQLLVQFRDFMSAEELINMFIELFPEYREDKPFPQDVLASLMLAYHRDENYEQVLEIWDKAWPRILKRCSINQPDEYKGARMKGIYPAHQYDVTRVMLRVALAYRAMNDGNGLLECVEKVVGAGFKLTSSTWNQIVLGLAEMGKWERGMYWCETMLMPGWQGWKPQKQPLEQRRLTMNTRVLQPSARAILALQDEWLETRRLAVWSGEVARKLADMEERYPLLHKAFTTSNYNDVPGPWIFRGDVDLVAAMTEMLTPLSLNELRSMQKALEEQFATVVNTPGSESGREDTSPFRRFGSEDVETRALHEVELKLLRSVLQQQLSRSNREERKKRLERKKQQATGTRKQEQKREEKPAEANQALEERSASI